MSSFVHEFEEYAASLGLKFECSIVEDGLLHRAQISGDRKNSKNGWYIYHNEIIPVCIFGTWKGEQKHVWSAKHKKEMNKAELNKIKLLLKESSRKAKRQRMLEQKAAAVDCGEIYNKGVELTEHIYLNNKLIKTNDVLRLGEKGALIIPVVSQSGVLCSLQYIYPNGKKIFHPSGNIKGGFCPLDGKGEVIFVCEGYATGATINEATGNKVYVAFNCGNLQSVARYVQNMHQHNMIVIAGDDDFMTKEPIDNPGKHHAEIAGKALGVNVIYPKFNSYQRKKYQTDFNDMHHEGATNSDDNYVKNHILSELDRLIGGQLS